MKKNIFYLSILLFFTFIFTIFYIGLDKPNFYKPKEVKNKNLEEFISTELFSNKQFNSKDIIENNNFTLINIWSSWCAPCRSEHAILMSLSKKRRHEIKRKIRRFEENFEYTSGDHNSIDNFEEIFEDFIRLHRLSSNEKNIFMNNDREKFFKELIYRFLSENNLLYSYLKIENQTVACSISFSQNNIRYLYNSGFDPEYIKHSTGLINHLFAIKRSIENKYKIFDFMRGNERYKYDLGGIDKKVYSILLERK